METKQAEETEKLPISSKLMVVVLLVGTFVAILNQTLLTTALPVVIEDLQISVSTAQWLTSAFMLVNGIMIPITAFLIDKFTARRLYMTALGLFAAGTLICGLSPNFELLIIGRIIQAAGAGIMMPLMQTIFLIIFPFERRGSAMGMVGLVIAFAPALGPTLSGFIVDNFPWRTMFFVVLPIVVINLIAAYFILKNVTTQTFPKIDIVSIILSSIGFGGFLYGLSNAATYSWGSLQVIIPLMIGLIGILIFIIRQLILEVPILEFRVFKYPMFALGTGITMLVSMTIMGAATIIPIYMQIMRGYSALESGLLLLPGAIIMGLSSMISGRIFDKVGAKWLSIIGVSIVVVTTFLLTNLSTETSYFFIMAVYGIRLFGMSMVNMPVQTAGLNQLPMRLIPHGTAMSGTMRQVSASMGVAFLVTIMTNAAIGGADAVEPAHMIHGVNVAFIVATILSVIALFLTFFVKKTVRPEEEEQVVVSKAK